MLRVIEYFAKSLKVNGNDNVEYGVCKSLLVFHSSSRMRFMSHNWSATKQRLHPQNVVEISRHSVLLADRIQQCETLSGSRHKDTDQCL